MNQQLRWIRRIQPGARAATTALATVVAFAFTLGCGDEPPEESLGSKAQAFTPGPGAVLTGFRAETHGFGWENATWLKTVHNIVFDIDIHTEALCGGMAFAAVDHFLAGRQTDQYWYPPATGTQLREFIYQRQMHSLGFETGPSAGNIAAWAGMSGLGNGELGTSMVGEWNKMVAEIQQGRPVILGLRVWEERPPIVAPSKAGHQIVAFGFDAHGYAGDFGAHRQDIQIFAYDPNLPGENLTLVFHEESVANGDPVPVLQYEGRFDEDACVAGCVAGGGTTESCEPGCDRSGQALQFQYDAFFVENYQAHVPPPADPPPAYTDGLVHELIVQFVNNGDDLRGGNDIANIKVGFVDMSTQTLANINGSQTWDGNSNSPGREYVRFKLATPMPADQFLWMEISDTFSGGVNSDNWDIDAINVFPVTADASVKPANHWSAPGPRRLTGRRDPYKFSLERPLGYITQLDLEFLTATPFLYDPLNPPTLAPPEQLRVEVLLPDGRTQVEDVANQDLSYEFGTTNTASVVLNRPIWPCELDELRVRVIRPGGSTVTYSMDQLTVRGKGRKTDMATGNTVEFADVIGSYGAYDFTSPTDWIGVPLSHSSCAGGGSEDPGDPSSGGLGTSQPPPDPAAELVDTIYARFYTGGDDLRGGTDNLNLEVATKDNRVLTVENINFSTGMPGSSVTDLAVLLPEAVRLCDLEAIRLTATFGNQPFPMTPDNWNMDLAEFRHHPDADPFTIFGAVRLTNEARVVQNDAFVRECLVPGPELPVTHLSVVDAIHARFYTGADGLAGGTQNLDMTVIKDDLTPIALQNINAGMPLPPNSVIDVVVPLPEPLQLCDIQLLLLQSLSGGVWDMTYAEYRLSPDTFAFAWSPAKTFDQSTTNDFTMIQTLDCPQPEAGPLPNPIPPAATVCTPGDRLYCNDVGACNAEGTACICEDPAHRDPAERCAIWHEVPSNEETACDAGSRTDCNNMGVCSADGAGCICDDPEHWWATDNCSLWHSGPEVVEGSVCTPGDQADCNWLGTCNDAGTACVCTDPQHWWASDNCSVWHSGPEPTDEPEEPQEPPTPVCTAGDQAYCSWMGACNSAGTACVCNQPQNWWWSDRCSQWHNGPDPNQPPAP